MSNLVDKIQDIVDELDYDITVVSTDGVRINVCDTKWITEKKFVRDQNDKEYKVTAFLENEWVDVTPVTGSPADFSGPILKAPLVYFFHGTPASVNNEYGTNEQKTSNKTPFVWLLEPYEDDDGTDSVISSLAALWKPKLLCLEWADEDAWLNDKHNRLAIKPMTALSEAIEGVVNDSFDIQRTSFRRKTRPRFGVDRLNRGSDKKIFEGNFSGIQTDFNLGLYKTNNCKC